MSGCVDKMSCDCESLGEFLKGKRNMIASVISGTLVSQSFHEL